MSFGQRLKGLRRDFDLSQAELADQAGCSVNTVRKLESGERRPSRELAMRLAAVFELPQRDRAEFLRLARGSQSLAQPGLPSPMTRLIGREQDIATVRDRLLGPDVRLLTLVGPPGVGKTRLALQVATEVQEKFRDGAAFVALAAIHDASLVLDSAAHVLGVRGTPSRSLEQALMDHLRQRHLLLVLDNFEQVITAREHLPALLSAAAKLKILVTSREALDLYGEHVYGVPTLGLPNRQAPRKGHILQRSSSELLFLERARATRPGFASSPGDQPLVAEICLRLEGLPLAIELAASRAKTMGPARMLAELSRRLDVLSAGPTDFSPRQRSIRGALDWSYELLNDDERRVFERMALFAGSATPDAILSVSGEQSQPESVRQAVENLTDKSLLTATEVADMTRLGMLETIREYALERLMA